MNIALIGLGQISVLYDYNRFSNTVLSHLKGIYLNNLNLKYISDVTILNVSKVKRFFPNVKFIPNYRELKRYKDIDLLVIATPTYTHYKILNYFKNSKIDKILIEKPLFFKKNKIKKFQKKDIIINYIRNFEPTIKKRLDEINQNDIQKIVFKYSKGLIHNGSHFFHLLFEYFNVSIKNFNLLNKVDNETFDMFLETDKFPVFLLGFDENRYSIWEIEIFLNNRLILIKDFSREIQIYEVVNDLEYDGYKMLNTIPKTTCTKMSRIMFYVYKNLDKKRFLSNEYKMLKFYERMSDEISN